ncbi:MAG: thioesterase family protein [Actinomycetota bacterium]
MDAFYIDEGDRVVPTELTRGPWDARAQHGGPPSAILARALERCGENTHFPFVRITLEILRPVPIAAVKIEARVARGSRSVELLEGSLRDDDGEIMRATAWRMRAADLDPSIEEREDPPPGPEDGEVPPFFETSRDVGYHTAMEFRFLTGSFRESGPAMAWARMRVPLVAGEEPSPLQRVLVAADSGNGISSVLDYHKWLFINTDLTVHLFRMPQGEWINLDSVTTVSARGVGLAETVLRDSDGRIGRGMQSLLVAPRSLTR